jgi:hypothetical protein
VIAVNLTQQIADAEAEVARLKQLAASATCAELGHDMQSTGGRNCGCKDGSCSVPVNHCTRCGDCDYGDNEEADEVRANCDANQTDGIRTRHPRSHGATSD